MISEEVQASSELGTIRIADEVVSTIAGLAATQVEGVAAMSGGIAGGLAEALGRRNFSKGVKVEVGSEETIINVYIIVKYGFRIPDIAWEIQENIKKAIESMTGLRVVQVNVHVQGVSFPHQKEGTGQDTEELTVK